MNLYHHIIFLFSKLGFLEEIIIGGVLFKEDESFFVMSVLKANLNDNNIDVAKYPKLIVFLTFCSQPDLCRPPTSPNESERMDCVSARPSAQTMLFFSRSVSQ